MRALAKKSVLMVLILASFAAHANSAPSSTKDEFAVGFNQGWFFNRYSSQWVSDFNANESLRILKLAKNANSNILRLWLFEGSNSQSLIWNNEKATGLNPQFVTNLKIFLKQAQDVGVKLNFTLLDGNSAKQDMPINLKNYWWDLLNAKNGVRKQFINDIYLPLLKVLDAPEFAGVVTQLDLVNEINVYTFNSAEIKFTNGWSGANQFVCDFYRAKQSVGSKISQTASIGYGNSARKILNGDLRHECVDFFDFHVYDSGGEIPNCKEVAAFAHNLGKKIQLGEFGQELPHKAWDFIQKPVTRNFLRNAKACGLDGAMAWRLAEPEAEAYLAFELQGQLRPAYFVFQEEAARILKGH